MLKSKDKKGYSALPPISSFCPPQIIGLSQLVMCVAYTATIPPDSWLSVYRLLAGVYYSEGRCQREEEVGLELAGRLWRLWRQVKDWGGGYLYLHCYSTVTQSVGITNPTPIKTQTKHLYSSQEQNLNNHWCCNRLYFFTPLFSTLTTSYISHREICVYFCLMSNIFAWLRKTGWD